MGRVDLAMRTVERFRRFYAVKHLHPHFARDPRARQMLEEEARIAGALSHPNVVGVHDYGEDSVGPYLVMDFVDGMTLARVLALEEEDGERLPISVCVGIARDIARGLDAIHNATNARGQPLELVHRDLSPRNVLLGFDGSVRVTDFGIARAEDRDVHTTMGLVKGTPGYLAPERLRFEAPCARTDLFSLGVLLHEMLSGERLYGGGIERAAKRILTEPVPDIGEVRPETPPGLTNLLFHLLAKSPDDRPASAAEVVRMLDAVDLALPPDEPRVDLGSYLSTLAPEMRRAQREVIDAAVARAEAPRPRRRIWALGVALTALAGVGLVVAFVMSREIAPGETSRAEAPSARTAHVVVAPIEIEAEPAPELPIEAPDPTEPEAQPASTRRRRRARSHGASTPREMSWSGDLR